MNKRATAILFIAVVVLAMAFFFLWQREQPRPKEMEQLCQNSAAAALEAFKGYASSGDAYRYWDGVAEFRCFMKAYLYLHDGHSDPDYLYCNELYGQMTLYPEGVMANVEDLITALEYLSQDYTDPNGYHHIASLNNKLTRG